MKSHQFGLQGILFSACTLVLQCSPLQAQDSATNASNNASTDTSKGGSAVSQQVYDQLNTDALADANQAVAHNPNFAPAYEDRGFAKMRLSDLDGAIADFSKAIELSPQNDGFYRDRGEAKAKKSDLDGATADYERALALNGESPLFNQGEAEDKNAQDKIIADSSQRIAKNPKDTMAYCNRGQAKESEGDFDGAIADYSQAISLIPTGGVFYTQRGEVKDKKGDLDGAIADDNLAISIDPKDADFYISRGTVKLHQSDFDGAIADFSQAVALNPSYTLNVAYDDRGLAKHKKGDLAGAIADYEQAYAPHQSANGGLDGTLAAANQKIALNPNDAWALSSRAGTKAIKGDLAGAVADYSQAIALDPQNTNLANVYFYTSRGEVKVKQGDLDGAISDFNQAIKLDPQKAAAYIDSGKVMDKEGDYNAAISDFNQAIAIDPKKAKFYADRGEVKFHQGDIDGAIADFSQAIAIDPGNARFYTGRGEVNEKKGDLDAAVADYSQAITDDPQDAYAFAYRGRVKAVKGDWDGAIADCDKALEWNPSLSVAYYNRGTAKDKKGDHEGAVADFNEAISYARIQGGRLPSSPRPVQPDKQGVALGTGFFVTSDGYLLTDYHVVKGASTLKVKTGNGIMSASLVAKDDVNDIALLKIDGTYACLPLGDSSAASLGQTVFTVGFPEPQLQGLSPKFTKGEISSLQGMQDDPRMFQISVPVQPGNSGGCLVDESGNVVGLIESTLSTIATAQGSGDLLQNVNYATKINYAKALLATVQETQAGIAPANKTPATFSDEVKAVEDATVFIIADSSGNPPPLSHLYKDSSGNMYSVSESDYQRLYPQKVALDAENLKLNRLDAERDAQARRVEQDRQNLDNTDPQAVGTFNAEVDRLNAFKDKIQQETNAFNDGVDKFNTELKRVGTLIR